MNNSIKPVLFDTSNLSKDELKHSVTVFCLLVTTFVTTSKALVTTSVALVTNSFLLLTQRWKSQS